MGLVPAGTTLKNLNWSFGPLRWFGLHGLGPEGPPDIPQAGVRGFWPSGGRIGKSVMARPAGIDIVRRAYKLWEQAGKPEGRDQEFYLQAERELQEALDKEKPDQEPPSDDR
jgi:Protein of unknown function (DUF2934)